MGERTLTAREGNPPAIAMLAPPWISIPPPGYGGIEQVVDLLAGSRRDAGGRAADLADVLDPLPAVERDPSAANRVTE